MGKITTIRSVLSEIIYQIKIDIAGRQTNRQNDVKIYQKFWDVDFDQRIQKQDFGSSGQS